MRLEGEVRADVVRPYRAIEGLKVRRKLRRFTYIEVLVERPAGLDDAHIADTHRRRRRQRVRHRLELHLAIVHVFVMLSRR